jgi:hypothetical protein
VWWRIPFPFSKQLTEKYKRDLSNSLIIENMLNSNELLFKGLMQSLASGWCSRFSLRYAFTDHHAFSIIILLLLFMLSLLSMLSRLTCFHCSSCFDCSLCFTVWSLCFSCYHCFSYFHCSPRSYALLALRVRAAFMLHYWAGLRGRRTNDLSRYLLSGFDPSKSHCGVLSLES